MKTTVSFNYPTAGCYEGKLTGVFYGQNKWTRSLQYVFDFALTHKFSDNGTPEPLRKSLKYSRIIQLTEDNEMLHKFLQAINWPDSEDDEMEFESVGGNEVKIPIELPRLFWVDFSKGTSRAAQFKSIIPVISDGVN